MQLGRGPSPHGIQMTLSWGPSKLFYNFHSGMVRTGPFFLALPSTLEEMPPVGAQGAGREAAGRLGSARVSGYRAGSPGPL